MHCDEKSEHRMFVYLMDRIHRELSEIYKTVTNTVYKQ